MQAWKDIVQCISKEKRVDVYPNSVHEAGGSECFVARIGGKKLFLVCGGGEGFELFNGKEACFNGVKIKFCEMDNENAKIARKLFPHASPVSFEGRDTTLGLGDRLGLASPGHLRLLRGRMFSRYWRSSPSGNSTLREGPMKTCSRQQPGRLSRKDIRVAMEPTATI